MSNDHNLQECGTLNRVFASYFLNEAEKAGVDFQDSKPIMERIAEMNGGNWFFTEKDSPNGLKTFFHGRVEIPVIDLAKLRTVGIYEFFDDEMRGQLMACAHHFASEVKQAEHCDFVFSPLPDAPPYLFDCIMDVETNFKSRLIIGRDIANETHSAVWEFYCLLMSKFREADTHPIYGKHFKNVDSMTDEERAKFYKKPNKDVEVSNEQKESN